MMDHIYKVICPNTFLGWADGVRQWHQDNTVVQNIRGIYEDDHQKKKGKKWTPQQVAKMLGIKMPMRDPDAMDTRADQSRSNYSNNRAATTQGPPKPKRKRVCFHCNKEGHF